MVHEELGRLPDRFQGVAVLCDLEGKTYAEAARLAGLPDRHGHEPPLGGAAEAAARPGAARAGAGWRGDRDGVGGRGRGDNHRVPTRALEEATVQAATAGILSLGRRYPDTRSAQGDVPDTGEDARGEPVDGGCAAGRGIHARRRHDSRSGEHPRSRSPPGNPTRQATGRPRSSSGRHAVSVLVRDARGLRGAESGGRVPRQLQLPGPGHERRRGNRPVPHPGRRPGLVGGRPEVGDGPRLFRELQSWPTTRVQPLPATLTLVLGNAQTVRVKLIGSDDRPVPGIEVATWSFHKKGKIAAANLSGGTIAQVTTDADGIATFDFVPTTSKEASRSRALPESMTSRDRSGTTPPRARPS